MKLLQLIFIFSIFTSCAQTTKKKSTSINTMKDIKHIPKEKQITYAIHINAKTPYEIYIDDIPLPGFGRFYESGMNATLELNPYLLRNGTHKLKIRYLPLESAKDSLLHPGDVYHNKDAKWNIFFVRFIKNSDDPLGYEGEIDYGNSELEVVPPPRSLPFWEQEFDLDIKDLPYTLDGWGKSQDLSELDREELKKDVFSFYKDLRTTLNKGDADKFIKLTEKRNQELSISTYDYDQSYFYSEEHKEDIKSKCTGNIWEINEQDYSVKVYAYGKIVSLERIGEFKNNGVIAETETNYYSYNLKLHKPIGSDTFEIIRK
ncbi:hypothetical protein Q4566_15765 [Tamlana sp. 2_MG-2023]|uniref:hypothetical protein n=1 Tax=unclassified Tamlana TaxID=2614803 RepID=UPI0026E41C1E|nr:MULTISPECIES: hypothetical protein [unclassified Tamlana]MDO6761664.1 hypothetical protein [Tamlana sp. 2_MG-2023]MDO6792490.1 hypothetical protein [Tamlana sp. 1_MG-2023]